MVPQCYLRCREYRLWASKMERRPPTHNLERAHVGKWSAAPGHLQAGYSKAPDVRWGSIALLLQMLHNWLEISRLFWCHRAGVKSERPKQARPAGDNPVLWHKVALQVLQAQDLHLGLCTILWPQRGLTSVDGGVPTCSSTSGAIHDGVPTSDSLPTRAWPQDWAYQNKQWAGARCVDSWLLGRLGLQCVSHTPGLASSF